MSSDSPINFLPLRKRNTHLQQLSKKKSLFLIKRHPFFRQSPEKDHLSSDSNNSDKDSNSREMKTYWTTQQELKLIQSFKDYGANWLEISNNLDNKQPFEIKRHFEMILKKLIESMNKQLREKGLIKQMQFRIFRTAIESTNQVIIDKNDESSTIKDQMSKLMYNYLTNYEEFYANSQLKSVETAQTILFALKKRRLKKKNSSKASTEIYMKEDLQLDIQIERGYMSDSSSVFQQPQQNKDVHNCSINHDFFSEDIQQSENNAQSSKGVIVEESQQRIKELLRDSGVLEVQQSMPSPKNRANNSQESGISGSQNLNNESYQHFYDEDFHQKDFYWKMASNSSKN